MFEAAIRVLILHQKDVKINAGIVHLQNPRTGNRGCYLLTDDGIQEIHWFKQPYSSWFIGDSVCEDGSLYLGSDVDSIFMVLPLLEQARMKKGDDSGVFRSLEDILVVDGYPAYTQMQNLLAKTLPLICDVQDVSDSSYYRLNDVKVLGWLCCKVKRTSEALKSSGDTVFASLDEDALKTYTVGFLGEYLKVDPWLQRLCAHLSVDLEASKKSRDTVAKAAATVVPLKKIKCGGSNKKSSKGASQSGSAKIASFFMRPR